MLSTVQKAPCAPGDQRKSSDDQRQQVELSARRFQQRAYVTDGMSSASREIYVHHVSLDQLTPSALMDWLLVAKQTFAGSAKCRKANAALATCSHQERELDRLFYNASASATFLRSRRWLSTTIATPLPAMRVMPVRARALGNSPQMTKPDTTPPQRKIAPGDETVVLIADGRAAEIPVS